MHLKNFHCVKNTKKVTAPVFQSTFRLLLHGKNQKELFNHSFDTLCKSICLILVEFVQGFQY